jgi:uncharacterized protein YdhG (YjbR/CyaY superfamily)
LVIPLPVIHHAEGSPLGQVVISRSVAFELAEIERVDRVTSRTLRQPREFARCETAVMAKDEVDRYLAALDEPKRSTLEQLRASILEVIPEAEQCISYGMPAFRIGGKVVAGFAAFKNHLSYLPHSGSVLSTLADEVSGYESSKGALRFAIDKPLPERLVKKLVAARLRELDLA